MEKDTQKKKFMNTVTVERHLKFLHQQVKNLIEAQSRHTVSSSFWRENLMRQFKEREAELGWTDLPKV